MHRRTRATLSVGLAAVLLASSCSEGDETGSSATTSSTAAAPSSAPSDGGAPAASAGCDGPAPEPGRTTETIASGGIERSYVRYVPEDAEGPRPLVVDLTAYSPADLQERISGFTQPGVDETVKADEVGAVVVTPEPVGGAGDLLTWNLTDQEGWADDDQFLDEMLTQVASDTCLEPGETVVMGFAIGAVMASRLACTRADEVALLVAVSGLDDPPGCTLGQPVPVLAFHGTGDRFLPYDGGVGGGAAGLPLSPETTAGLLDVVARRGSVTESAAAWAGRDGCDADPTTEDATAGVTIERWEGCEEDATVELVTIEGGEHTWPGSTTMDDLEPLLGPVSDAVVANDVIWDRYLALRG